ncbi:MAG TPA: hypothetical protein VJT13_21310 [Xanthobacteraceae bacterium]|nr:hypothetical protein [Xanthobacteraceae bacterium]
MSVHIKPNGIHRASFTSWLNEARTLRKALALRQTQTDQPDIIVRAKYAVFCGLAKRA